MDEAIRQAREQRALAQDFFTANPTRHYLSMGGSVYTSDGRVIQPPTGTDQTPQPKEPTAGLHQPEPPGKP